MEAARRFDPPQDIPLGQLLALCIAFILSHLVDFYLELSYYLQAVFAALSHHLLAICYALFKMGQILHDAGDVRMDGGALGRFEALLRQMYTEQRAALAAVREDVAGVDQRVAGMDQRVAGLQEAVDGLQEAVGGLREDGNAAKNRAEARYRNAQAKLDMAAKVRAWRNEGRPQRTPSLVPFWSEVTGQPMPFAGPRERVEPGLLPRTALEAWRLDVEAVNGLAPHCGVVGGEDDERRARVLRELCLTREEGDPE